ncbi:MAG: hypothetical protein KatS3mg123_2388 [Burkholderiales bacterium]|nr:MAG: hypothetical protein KatS3mg123_2388 [Burkholderiales bacterium]
MASRSVYGLYSTITLGVADTPMTSFQHLSEEDRWALAFYVAGMGIDPALAEKGAALWKDGAGRDVFTGLKPLATLTRKEVAEKHGEDAAAVMAWLAAHPEAVDPAAGLAHRREPPAARGKRGRLPARRPGRGPAAGGRRLSRGLRARRGGS